jgi:hypothetical protein
VKTKTSFSESPLPTLILQENQRFITNSCMLYVFLWVWHTTTSKQLAFSHSLSNNEKFASVPIMAEPV